ncbi:MAG TPA: hypothetical protein VJ840_08420 [Gemmatimonadaceae bacterium]|nr:hypothetical protein [Gemmatimonadaceae bacterium]
MYSTCIFCQSPLGSNEAIESFPVGRRLAFDVAKGRLWAVCRKCERWNLTPLEERWEAIEQCERSFRETRLRASTDEIGLGKLSEGTELVRIGKPLRPEFAAWRYGDQFGRRRRKHLIQVGVGFAAGLAIPIWGPLASLSLGGLGISGWQLLAMGRTVYHRVKIVTRVHDDEGRSLFIRRHDVREAIMLPAKRGESWGLAVMHRANAEEAKWWKLKQNQAVTDVRGDAAVRAAAQLLPHINREGARASQINDAVKIASEHDNPTKPFERAANYAKAFRTDVGPGVHLATLPIEMRLALEMASHEDAERRAMEGELMQLEDAWREAEEIASIADDLFLPESITQRLDEIKKRSTGKV